MVRPNQARDLRPGAPVRDDHGGDGADDADRTCKQHQSLVVIQRETVKNP